MSAEELRQAATTLRAYSNGATEGPWRATQEIDGVRAGMWTTVKAHGRRVVTVGQARPHHNGEAEMNVGYIATMHPGVGLALADWLDATACPLGCTVEGRRFPYCSACEDSTYDHDCPDPVKCDHTPPFRNALALARLINGGAS